MQHRNEFQTNLERTYSSLFCNVHSLPKINIYSQNPYLFKINATRFYSAYTCFCHHQCIRLNRAIIIIHTLHTYLLVCTNSMHARLVTYYLEIQGYDNHNVSLDQTGIAIITNCCIILPQILLENHLFTKNKVLQKYRVSHNKVSLLNNNFTVYLLGTVLSWVVLGTCWVCTWVGLGLCLVCVGVLGTCLCVGYVL